MNGKSTVGQLIAGALALPLLDKDDFLEALFAAADVVTPSTRTMSRQADDQFIAAAGELNAAVLVSF